MAEITIQELKTQLDVHGQCLEDLKLGQNKMEKTQDKIASALLGSLDRTEPGLLEDQRVLKKEVEQIKETIKPIPDQISDLMVFKSNVKKVVAAIAFVIPFVFEIVKAGSKLAWNYFTGQHPGP